MTKTSNKITFPLPFKFDTQEYHRLVEVGILREDSKVELLNGQILSMSPVGSNHAACVEIISDLFKSRFKGVLTVRAQQPILLSNYSEPEPDIGVYEFSPSHYAQGHPVPKQAILLIEVADSSLQFDQTTKLTAYAQAGIPEYWVIDLAERQLFRYSQLDHESNTYQEQKVIIETESIEHEELDRFDIVDLLPLHIG